MPPQPDAPCAGGAPRGDPASSDLPPGGQDAAVQHLLPPTHPTTVDPKLWRYAYLAIALVLVLGLGVGLAARFGGGTTTTPSSSGPARSSDALRSAAAGAPSGTFPPAGTRQLGASLRALMALRPAGGKAAPGFTLTDAATGAEVSLVDLRSRAVVLTFSNAACNDICPVLATELHRAASLLGHTNVPVTFVTINTDPLDTAPGSARIVDQPLLSSMPDWKFLTGTIAQLNPVWRAYGISITVDEATRQVSHDNALYFVSPSGRLVWSATPFADESPDGVYTLPAAEIARFAKGIARYAGGLADRP